MNLGLSLMVVVWNAQSVSQSVHYMDCVCYTFYIWLRVLQVFEINPSMLRTTKTIMERVHESTRSQQVHKGKGVSMDKVFDNMAQGRLYIIYARLTL